MTQPRPVAIGFAEGLTPIEELVMRVAAGHHDYAIMLAGGMALSRKTIRHPAEDRWEIVNHIDGSRQTLPEAGLWESSHIGEALDKRALLDLSGDPILKVEGRGPVLGSTVHAEGVEKAKAWREQRARERAEQPLVFHLDAAPGAIRVGEPNEDHVDHGEWEPADPALDLHVMDIGPATVAEIDLEAVSFGGRFAATSIELTIEDIDSLIATLTGLREDAIANRGFAQDENGFWTNGRD